jgi:hypothetical protein
MTIQPPAVETETGNGVLTSCAVVLKKKQLIVRQIVSNINNGSQSADEYDHLTCKLIGAK